MKAVKGTLDDHLEAEKDDHVRFTFDDGAYIDVYYHPRGGLRVRARDQVLKVIPEASNVVRIAHEEE